MAWIYSAAMVEACESWPCSPGPAAASSLATSAATAPCAPSSGTPTPQAFSSDSKTLATYRRSRYGMTCAPLTAARGEALLTAFLAGSRAKTSASPAVVPGSTASGPGCGESSPGWFAKWSPNGSEWRTAQRSLLGDSELFSATWPRSGSMRDGMCFQQPTVAHLICVSGSGSSPGVVYPTPCTVDSGSMFNQSASDGAALRPTLGAMARHRLWPTPTASLGAKGGRVTPRKGMEGGSLIEAVAARTMWPTPTAQDAEQAGGRNCIELGHRSPSLSYVAQMFPTPAARDFRHPNSKSFEERGGGSKGEQLPNSVGGPLNPQFVEWLMGWPLDWTAPAVPTESGASETGRFHEWLQQHGFCWPRA